MRRGWRGLLDLQDLRVLLVSGHQGLRGWLQKCEAGLNNRTTIHTTKTPHIKVHIYDYFGHPLDLWNSGRISNFPFYINETCGNSLVWEWNVNFLIVQSVL